MVKKHRKHRNKLGGDKNMVWGRPKKVVEEERPQSSTEVVNAMSGQIKKPLKVPLFQEIQQRPTFQEIPARPAPKPAPEPVQEPEQAAQEPQEGPTSANLQVIEAGPYVQQPAGVDMVKIRLLQAILEELMKLNQEK